MPDPIIDPPAIVKPAAEIQPRVRELVVSAKRYSFRAAGSVIQAGIALLKAKALCKMPGEWGAVLQDVGISRQWAYKLIARAIANYEKVAKATFSEVLDPLGQPAPDDKDPPMREIGDEDDENAFLKFLICKGCQRKGVRRDCEACQKLRQRVKSKKKSKSGGSISFDWGKWKNQFTPIAQAPERIVKSYPDEKNTAEHRRAVVLLDELAELMKRWRERVQGAKK